MSTETRSLLSFALVSGTLIFATGCHSAFVQATITNQGPIVQTVELDYPSQSFGTTQLVTNQIFHYRFKVLGSGPVKLSFTDAGGKSHTSTGPTLDEATEGTLSAVIQPTGAVTWAASLRHSR